MAARLGSCGTTNDAALGHRCHHRAARSLAVVVSTGAALVLGFGLGVAAGMPLVVVVTTVWYEKVWLPRIAGDED